MFDFKVGYYHTRLDVNFHQRFQGEAKLMLWQYVTIAASGGMQ